MQERDYDEKRSRNFDRREHARENSTEIHSLQRKGCMLSGESAGRNLRRLNGDVGGSPAALTRWSSTVASLPPLKLITSVSKPYTLKAPSRTSMALQRAS